MGTRKVPFKIENHTPWAGIFLGNAAEVGLLPNDKRPNLVQGLKCWFSWIYGFLNFMKISDILIDVL